MTQPVFFMRSRALTALLLAITLLGSSGCAMVTMKEVASTDYLAVKRGDVLTTQTLSAASQETLSVAGIDPDQCEDDFAVCRTSLLAVEGIADEARLATLSELWVASALALTPESTQAKPVPLPEPALQAWLEAARHAYAYLFFSGRTPSQRAFEDRQTQVRDYYNYAAEKAASAMFERGRSRALEGEDGNFSVRTGDWTLTADLDSLQLSGVPAQLVSASSVRFAGLRSTYRRDGFGAELVLVMDPPTLVPPTPDQTEGKPAVQVEPPPAPPVPVYSEMSSIAATALLRFPGQSLQEVLQTHQVSVEAYEPETTTTVEIQGQPVPLAANFTAAYGLWLARSNFATQSLRTLFGRGEGISEPHIYLMQPYDPDRRIIFMLHGLASSPEAWVNIANELMGDPELREHFQVWQVYYPTNAPVAVNRYAIAQALDGTLRHFDPSGTARASQDMVFIGHSMGGVLARLLVTSSGDTMWNDLTTRYHLRGERLKRVQTKLGPLLRFDAEPNVERAIFIAAPHRGTDIAGNRVGRLIGRLVRLPITLLGKFEDVLQTLQQAEPDGTPEAERFRIPNSIDNLKASDPFVRATADLPIRQGLKYHSIIAHRKPAVPLQDSDDGLVPYWSAHLPGALSEKVIEGGHSVQETPQAVLEVRRILRLDIEEVEGGPVQGAGR